MLIKIVWQQNNSYTKHIDFVSLLTKSRKIFHSRYVPKWATQILNSIYNQMDIYAIIFSWLNYLNLPDIRILYRFNGEIFFYAAGNPTFFFNLSERVWKLLLSNLFLFRPKMDLNRKVFYIIVTCNLISLNMEESSMGTEENR